MSLTTIQCIHCGKMFQGEKHSKTLKRWFTHLIECEKEHEKED